jgi:hypothetical protein
MNSKLTTIYSFSKQISIVAPPLVAQARPLNTLSISFKQVNLPCTNQPLHANMQTFNLDHMNT